MQTMPDVEAAVPKTRGMPRKKKPDPVPENPPAKRYPSRDKVKYTYIPIEYWLALEAIGKPIERSVAFLVKQAVREYLERSGKLPKRPPSSSSRPPEES